MPESGPATVTVASKPTIDVRGAMERVAKAREAAVAPAIAPATPAEPVKPSVDPEIAIALERHKAEGEVLREKLARLEADAQRRDAAETARKADWQTALRDAGYKPEDVLPAWIQGTEAKPTATGDNKETELMSRIAALEGTITGARAEHDRERRMAAVRSAMGPEDGDDYAVMRTIGADAGFLDMVFAEEKRRGVPVGENELATMLKAHEGKARDTVKPQIERLARSKWGKELIAALLAETDKTETPTETREEPEVPRAPMLGEDRQVVRLGRDLHTSMEEAKRKALARFAAK